MTIDNFINNNLADNIEAIFSDINAYVFEQENVDTNHVYIDGTKLPANANKYSWVWKKSCLKNRQKVFVKVTQLLEEMNQNILLHGIKFGTREEYAIEYLEEILGKYVKLTGIDPNTVICGRGHHKSVEQRLCDQLSECIERLKKYADYIQICGEHRNSYSKTDHDVTFIENKA